MGEGRVVQILPLRQAVIVDLPEIGPRQFSIEELDRAEKIARGEEVEPLPAEEPAAKEIYTLLEDQPAPAKEEQPAKKRRSKSSSRRRRQNRVARTARTHRRRHTRKIHAMDIIEGWEGILKKYLFSPIRMIRNFSGERLHAGYVQGIGCAIYF